MKINYNYDEYEDWYDDEPHIHKMKSMKRREERKNKNKHKQRQSEAEFWSTLELELESDPVNTPVTPVEPVSKKVSYIRTDNPASAPTNISLNIPKTTGALANDKKPFTPGPNSHEVKGFIIDFDRVDRIEKIDNVLNDRTTYGVKFVFSGSKGFFRIAWFNTNMRERDACYSKELTFWHNLQK